MLHRIQLPDCVPQLEQIRQFQRDVLALACSDQTILPLTENLLKNSLGDNRGIWLWRKLWKQRGEPGETTFHLALIAVIRYVQKNPTTRQTILDAFDNDVTFHNSLDDPDFRFQFNILDKAIRDILKPFMISFYENLLASGFETAIHGQPRKLNRDEFISSFWRANDKLEVCPSCDGRRPNVADFKHRDDADHYLPKSKYPYLSLHYANLVPMCLECNRSFKGNTDPIDNHSDAPLPNIFHPYERPALDYVEVLVNSNSEGVRQIEFEDRNGMPSRRVENLNRIFRLHKRWPDELRHQVERLRDTIADKGRDARFHNGGKALTEKELQYHLETMLQQKQERLGKRAGYILQASYLTFALQNRDEFEALFKEFTG